MEAAQENFDQQALAAEQALGRESAAAGRPPQFGDVAGLGSGPWGSCSPVSG